MNHDLIVSESIDVNAKPSDVWEALTNPEMIKEYLFGTEAITDWQEGSEIVFQGEYEGHKYRDKGIVKENILNEKISYSYWSGFSGLEDNSANYSLVTYSLRQIDNKTRLTWTQKGYANEQAYEHSKSGMQAFLATIKALIERK